MERNEVVYTAIYPTTDYQADLTEILEKFTGNNYDNYYKLLDLEATYPDFYKWYLFKVLPDIKHNRNGRRLLFAISYVYDGETISKRLTGLAIIKDTNKEKKICTFRVFPDYRGQGVGTKLLRKCFSFLGTSKPLISISDGSVEAFSKIITAYEWTLCDMLHNYYKKGITEYVYNGYLT